MSEEKIDLWADKTASVEPPQETVEEVAVAEIAETLPETVEDTVIETAEQPVIQERIVEKQVEKQPEFKDEYSRQIYESLISGDTNEVYKYLQEKNRDYQAMSDYDVVKEGLKLSNPKWTDKDIQIELKSKYGAIPERKDMSDLDPQIDREEYNEAVAFNNRIDEKELLLSRDARDFRYTLEDQKKTIELPKISKEQAQPQALSPVEIEEANRIWEAKVDAEHSKLSDFKIKVGDEEVTYKISEAEKKESHEFMKNFDGAAMAQKRGWVDENGNENVLRIAEDMLKLEKFDLIVASAATQMKTSAKKAVISEIKNIDLKKSTQSPDLNKTLAEAIWG